MTITPQQFETLTQAAERTGISTWTLRRRIASGELAAFTVGRRILRVRPEDVDGLFRPLPSIARR
nr:helix-turn-helix domain-containing protein [Propionibacterium sp.]